MLTFDIKARNGLARSAVLTTAHGTIHTPTFMTVGTLGAAKGITPVQLQEHGAEVLLMNAFHLAWRPGEELVREMGGLRRFCGWDRPILTDSGGFQIFSLPGLRTIKEEGAEFASPVDGSLRMFTPETVVEIEVALGADMIMQLDQCPPHPCSPGELTEAVDRSIRWAERSLKHFNALAPEDISLFGIVQGGTNEQERQRSIDAMCEMPFPGIALGGFSVGESTEAMHAGIAYSAPKLPEQKPRYLMGMGTPRDILHAVAQGVDMFDCTLPTRNGRNALAYTSRGTIRLRNACHARDDGPLDEHCGCYTCRTFSRSFLRHLFMAKEMNAGILTSLHNVAYYLNLMKGIREAIEAGRLDAFSREVLERFEQNGASED